MDQSDEVQKKEKLLKDGIADAVDHMVKDGWNMTPDQAREIAARVYARAQELYATEPTEALFVLGGATMLEVAGEVLGILGPSDRIAWLRDLITVGGATAQHLTKLGGYPQPTPEQIKTIVHNIRLHAEIIVGKGPLLVNAEEARQTIRAFAAGVVRITLGEPPSRVHLN